MFKTPCQQTSRLHHVQVGVAVVSADERQARQHRHAMCCIQCFVRSQLSQNCLNVLELPCPDHRHGVQCSRARPICHTPASPQEGSADCRHRNLGSGHAVKPTSTLNIPSLQQLLGERWGAECSVVP